MTIKVDENGLIDLHLKVKAKELEVLIPWIAKEKDLTLYEKPNIKFQKLMIIPHNIENRLFLEIWDDYQGKVNEFIIDLDTYKLINYSI